MRIRNIVGNVPEPDELYGRKELLDWLWRQVESDNILLLAPRRFGKTGVMNHVLERPRAGWLPIYLERGIVNPHVAARAAVLGGVLSRVRRGEDGALSNRAFRNPFSQRKRVSPGRA